MPKRKRPLSVDEAIDQIGFGRFQLRLLLLLGVVHAAEAVANTIDPFLADHLDCWWGLRRHLMLLLPYCSLIGVCVGSLACGLLADRMGRRPVLLLSCFTGCYFILLSAAAQHSIWFLFLRFSQAAAVAGIKGVALAYIVEFLPPHCRGKMIVTYQLFWTVGQLLVVFLAFLFLPPLPWRPLVALTGLPLLLAGLLLLLLPPSPLSLQHRGRAEEAREVLLRVALINRAPAVADTLREQASAPPPAEPAEPAEPALTAPSGWRRRCFLYLFGATFLGLWLLSGFAANGSSLVAANLPLTPHECLPVDILMTRLATTNVPTAVQKRAAKAARDDSCCRTRPGERIDFGVQALEALHFAVGGAIAFVCIDPLGRRRTMTFAGAFATLLFLPLNFCLPAMARRALLMMTLSCAAALKSALAVYTLELLPTAHRAAGWGVCAALGAAGTMATPFIVLLALPNNRVQDAYILTTVILLTCALLALLLPMETGELPLSHSVGESTRLLMRGDGEGDGYRSMEAPRRRRRDS